PQRCLGSRQPTEQGHSHLPAVDDLYRLLDLAPENAAVTVAEREVLRRRRRRCLRNAGRRFHLVWPGQSEGCQPGAGEIGRANPERKWRTVVAQLIRGKTGPVDPGCVSEQKRTVGIDYQYTLGDLIERPMPDRRGGDWPARRGMVGEVAAEQ